MAVSGELDFEVHYSSQVCTLSLTVVEGSGPSLLGRDWLCHLTLDWKTIGLGHESYPSGSTAKEIQRCIFSRLRRT